MAFVTDSNRHQPLWKPPPTACLTASVAASEAPSLLMRPCPITPVGTKICTGPCVRHVQGPYA